MNCPPKVRPRNLTIGRSVHYKELHGFLFIQDFHFRLLYVKESMLLKIFTQKIDCKGDSRLGIIIH